MLESIHDDDIIISVVDLNNNVIVDLNILMILVDYEAAFGKTACRN